MSRMIEIDGVDVSECKYNYGLYKGVNGCTNLNLNPACSKNPNCYYKQLQRVKAELEQYKKSKQASYESMQNEWNKAVNELRDVKAEKQEKVLKMAEAEIEIEKLQAENEKLKDNLSEAEAIIITYRTEKEEFEKLLENKEKAYNHLCYANARKKEQIKNLNYMLFEEKEMTTQEWKLKYRLANKERKFIQYKEITNKRLNDYKQALEEVEKYCNECNLKADYTACEVLKIIDEVLK